MGFHDPVLPPKRPQPAQPTPVTVVGGAVVGSMAVTSTPLAPNAAAETGGNLDQQTLALKALTDLVDLNTRILATLEAIRLQLGAMGDVAVDPSDVADVAVVH